MAHLGAAPLSSTMEDLGPGAARLGTAGEEELAPDMADATLLWWRTVVSQPAHTAQGQGDSLHLQARDHRTW